MVCFIATFIKGFCETLITLILHILWSCFYRSKHEISEEGSMFCLPIFCRSFLQISYASHFSFSLMLVGSLVSSMILNSIFIGYQFGS